MPGYAGGNKARFLEDTAQLLRHIKEDSYRSMEVEPGHRVLDLGCGPASDTIHLGKIVGAKGLVVGIDTDEEMIALANEKADSATVSGWVQHRVADGADLPFEDNYFDSCHSERMFQHLTEPEAVLDEMIRVTKPGGRIVIVDADYLNSYAVNTNNFDLMWRIRRFKAEQHNMGYMGIQLYPLMNVRGLAVEVKFHTMFNTSYEMYRYVLNADAVEAGMLAAGAATEGELQEFNKELQRREAEGTLFWSGTMIILIGHKANG